MLMKWYSVGPGYIGTYLEARAPRIMDFSDIQRGFPQPHYIPVTGKPYAVRAAFGFGGDCLARKTGVPADPGIPDDLVVQQVSACPIPIISLISRAKKTTAPVKCLSPTLPISFSTLKAIRGGLPDENVTYGNEWDLYSASMAETSSRVRRAVGKLRAAELMSTMVSLERPAFLQGREKARDQAFEDLGLYREHDWTADGPVSRARRAAWQDLLSSEIEYYVNPLHADAG